MIAIAGAAIAIPSGIERRGSRTSPAINDAASGPVHANAMTDQKIAFFRLASGRIVCNVIGDAAPNFAHTMAPNAINAIVTSQRLSAPTLFNQRPTDKPYTFKRVANVKPANA